MPFSPPQQVALLIIGAYNHTINAWPSIPSDPEEAAKARLNHSLRWLVLWIFSVLAGMICFVLPWVLYSNEKRREAEKRVLQYLVDAPDTMERMRRLERKCRGLGVRRSVGRVVGGMGDLDSDLDWDSGCEDVD